MFQRTLQAPPHGAPFPPSLTPAVDFEEPMQVGEFRLSDTERRRRGQEGRCPYCGGQGHFRKSCPSRPKKKDRH